MGGMDGQWESPRKRRRIVDASWFGDHLPKGWKLLLGLKRKDGDTWVYCRGYVSPSGKHLLSCKEVSSYILSLIGHRNTVLPVTVENYGNISNLDKVTPGYPAGISAEENDLKVKLSSSTVVPIPISGDQEKQVILCQTDNQPTKELSSSLTCQTCNLNFNDENSFAQHQLSCNLHKAKRRKLDKQIVEGIILKDGKFECQICHKTFEEIHRYNGHIGVHVRYQGTTAEALSGGITEQVCQPTPSRTVPYDFSYMTVPIEEREHILMEGAAHSRHLISSKHKQEIKLHDIGNSLDETPETTNSPGRGKVMDDQGSECAASSCRDQESFQCNTSMVEKSDHHEDTKAFGNINMDENLTSHHSPATVQGCTEETCLDGCSNVKVMTSNEFEQVHPVDVKVTNSNNIMVDHFGTKIFKSEDVFEATVLNPSKCTEALCTTPNIGVSCVTPSALTSEICQTPLSSTCINNKFANFEVTEFVPEDIVENQSVNGMKQSSCKNSISTSLVIDSNVDHKNSSRMGVSIQPTYENLISTSLVNDSICGNSNEMNVPMESFCVQNSNSTTYLDISNAGCENSLEPSAFRNSISTSLVSVNSVGCENSSRMNVASTMNPEIEEYDGRDIQLNSGNHFFSLPGSRSHFSLETYADIFGSSFEDDMPLQLDGSKETGFNSSQRLSDKDPVTQSCMLDELNANCINIPFVDARLDGGGRNMQSEFDIGMKKTLFEELGSSVNELDSCFSPTVDRGQHVDANDTIQQNTRNSLQAGLSLMSPWSSNNIPMVNMMTEQQHEDEHNICGQKQDDISFNQLRLGTAGSSAFASLTNQGPVSGSMPPLTFGYATELASGSYTGVDLGWGLSLPNSGCQITSICVWCNREFSHQNFNIAGEPDSLGFICPTCKAKISGQFRM